MQVYYKIGLTEMNMLLAGRKVYTNQMICRLPANRDQNAFGGLQKRDRS